MTRNNSAILSPRTPLPWSGLAWGLLGVAAFSFTVPLTRIAVAFNDMPPLFIGAGRAVIAATLAIACLAVTKQRLPRGRDWPSLAIVALGVVIGFPILTTYALVDATASHSAVIVAILPAATAVFGALRAGERPSGVFWLTAALGAVAAVAFASLQGGSFSLRPSDSLLFSAVIVCAIAYAEGAVLSRRLGAWQTISWALVAASPVTATLTAISLVEHTPSASFSGWLSFAYLGVVSMFLGFFAWYRGLAIGPIAQVSQVQLTQPVMTLLWTVLLLRETMHATTLIGALAVILCALFAVRSRGRTRVRARTVEPGHPPGSALPSHAEHPPTSALPSVGDPPSVGQSHAKATDRM